MTFSKLLPHAFARDPRISYVPQPDRHTAQNTAEVSAYLGQRMDVVYEDYQTLVLCRDNNHRPAYHGRREEKALRDASANFLP